MTKSCFRTIEPTNLIAVEQNLCDERRKREVMRLTRRPRPREGRFQSTHQRSTLCAPGCTCHHLLHRNSGHHILLNKLKPPIHLLETSYQIIKDNNAETKSDMKESTTTANRTGMQQQNFCLLNTQSTTLFPMIFQLTKWPSDGDCGGGKQRGCC